MPLETATMLSNPVMVLNAKIKRILVRGGGERGVLDIGREFRAISPNSFLAVPVADFIAILNRYGVTFTNEEKKLILQQFDRDMKGTHILVHAFLTGIRTHLSPKRTCRIQEAWASIPNDPNGEVPLKTLQRRYNAGNHPLVLQGTKQESEIVLAFAYCFNEGTNPTRSVNFTEFEEYYSAVSAQIESDEFFNLLLNNTWGLAPVKRTLNSTTSAVHKLDGVTKLPMERSIVDKEQMVSIRKAAADTNALGQSLAKQIQTQFGGKYTELSRSFRQFDRDRNGALTSDEWSYALDNMGLQLSTAQKNSLFMEYDNDGDGRVRFEEFLLMLRKDALSSRRRALVRWAFDKFRQNPNGTISLQDIKRTFKLPHHPLITHGKATEEQLRRELDDAFDCIDRDGQVSYDEFEEYHIEVSQLIPNDRHFEIMMRNTWGDGSEN